MEVEQLQEENRYMPVHLMILDASYRKQDRSEYLLELNIGSVWKGFGR